MNFSPFTGHIPGTIPAIHQFAAKFGYEGGAGSLSQGQDDARYHSNAHFGQQHGLGLADGSGGGAAPKFRQPDNVVVSLNNVQNSVGVTLAGLSAMQTTNNSMGKYQSIGTPNVATATSLGFGQQYAGQLYATADPLHQQQQQAGNGQQQQMLKQEQRSTDKDAAGSYAPRRDSALCVQQQQAPQNQTSQQQQQQQVVVLLHEPKHKAVVKQEVRDSRALPGSQDFICTSGGMGMPSAWQSLAAPGSAVADYLSQLPASALPLGLHHLLKYSGADVKVADGTVNNLITAAVAANGLNTVIPNNGVTNVVVQTASLGVLSHGGGASMSNAGNSPIKKKKKKKPPKEKKPRPKPGEIRLTTALDGSTLYCCPECHVAYPERALLEQHLVGHTMERRFICDICNAALKRKDHLTRHKQSHNPERPYVCTVCLKAFKRKEQLTLHFVIHSGEKRHICQECGKGFYRKDHLRKHTRSHIARRVKAELSQQGAGSGGGTGLARAVPAPS